MLLSILLAGCSQNNQSSSGHNNINSSTDNSTERVLEISGPLVMGTHPSGSLINTIGMSLASVASDENVRINVSPYGGPSQWLPEMKDGFVHLGIESSHGTQWAYEGLHEYPEPNSFLRIVSGGVTPIFNGLLVRNNSDIQSVEDLKGKNVPTGFGSQVASHISTQAALATVGIGVDDFNSVPVTSITDAIELFKDGIIDVILLPTNSPDVRELDAGVGVRYLNLDSSDEAVDAVREFLPGADILPAKQGTPGLEVDTHLLSMSFMLVGHEGIPNETITSLLTIWWDHLEQLQETHPVMMGWVKERQVPQDPDLMTAPFHEAAISFYKEKGLWTEEHDQKQQELLSN